MKIEYRNAYIDGIRVALHTVSGKARMVSNVLSDSAIVKKCYAVGQGDERQWYIQLNPNKELGSSYMLEGFAAWRTVLYLTLEEMGVVNFRPTRVDLSINWYDPEAYEKYKKLNKLLICCIADAYNVHNCYTAADLWSCKSLSVAIKSDMIEAENYDKEAESKGQTETKNRLELRSKRIKLPIEEEFCTKWFMRLDKASGHFNAVQQRYNKELSKLWLEDQEREPKDRVYLSLDAFMLMYSDCFFCRKQMVEFLRMVGEVKPEAKAKRFKRNHRVEFFSQTDIKEIINGLKLSIKHYFEA